MTQGHNFSQFFEMSFSFKTMLNNMAYKSYLQQPKSLLEWRLIENLARNPGLMSQIDRTNYHQLTHAYGPIQK